MPDPGGVGKGYPSSIVSFKEKAVMVGEWSHFGAPSANARTDWDGYSKEKPDSFSHVPDKLWEAMVNSYGEGERIDFATLFDVPKWEVDFSKEPPVLNKFEVDDEKMLSYDYLSVIDYQIRISGYSIQENATESQLIEAVETYKDYLKQLHTLRENIAGVLNYPLQHNVDVNTDIRAFNSIYIDGGDQDLKNTFITYTNAYEKKLNWKVVSDTIKDHGMLNEEYFPQLKAALDKNSEATDGERAEFTNYLLKTNSNLFDDLEVSSEISQEWYMNFLADHVSKVIQSMGAVGSPEGKWEVPILWEIQQQKKAQQG